MWTTCGILTPTLNRIGRDVIEYNQAAIQAYKKTGFRFVQGIRWKFI